MSVKSERIFYGSRGQYLGFSAYVERSKAPLPAVIVLQEAWGLDEHIEDVVIRFAKAGYFAFAPDLYAEGGNRPAQLSAPRMAWLKEFVNTLAPEIFGDPARRAEALSKLAEPRRSLVGESCEALFGGTFLSQLDRFVPALVDTASFLRAENPLTRGAKVLCVGYCLGGGLAARLATADPELAAAVIYYGRAPTDESAIAKINCPVLGLYGGLDARVNAGIEAFAAAMKKHNKKFEYHIYEGAAHAFSNDLRPSYHAAATRDAFARTLELFRGLG